MSASTDPRAAMMSERALDEAVRTLAAGLGLLRYHTFRSEKSPPGFPDLVLTGKRGVLFRELKSQTGKPTPAQQEWLERLTEAGADAKVWRPESLLSGEVARELAAIAGLRGYVPLETPAVAASRAEGLSATAGQAKAQQGEAG